MVRNIIYAIIAIIVIYFVLQWAGFIGTTPVVPATTPPAATGTTTPPATN